MDPNTLSLDPDPGFLPNLDLVPDPDPGPDPDPRLCCQFWKKKLKIILEKSNFLYKSTFVKNKMLPKEILVRWVTELLIYILQLLSLFYPIFTCVDPDPYSEYGSGSTKLLNKDPIRIRFRIQIHNTAFLHSSQTTTRQRIKASAMRYQTKKFVTSLTTIPRWWLMQTGAF